MKRNTFRLITILLALALAAGLLPGAAGAATSGSTAGRVAVSFGVLNVRSAASSTASVLTVLQKDSYVTLISKSGGWWRVEYGKGQYGYCHADYIAPVSGSYAAHATGHLNVRAGPGTGNGVIGWLQPGEYVVVLSTSGTWHRILMTAQKPDTPAADYLSAGYALVSSAFRSYKQTDSRWAAKRIGTSGGTIGSIGCPTTALAMAESYRTKPPSTRSNGRHAELYRRGAILLARQLQGLCRKRLPQGGVWPAQQRDPCSTGRKEPVGRAALVRDHGFFRRLPYRREFLINDPGSNARTTLQQSVCRIPLFLQADALLRRCAPFSRVVMRLHRRPKAPEIRIAADPYGRGHAAKRRRALRK